MRPLARSRRCAGAPASCRRQPRYVARPADFDDTGVAQAAGTPGGWQAVEWDLVGPFGIDVPGAWTQLATLGARGGAGIKVAVVDTGVAYANRPPYRRSPDLPAKRMRPGYDFVANDRYPNDRSGHGTFVASAIAAAADNHFGMIGVAYGADIMPVRVLDSLDEGTSSAIARGIRYSVDHDARVINLSVEFFDLLSGRPYTITSSPDVRDAIRYAGEHRVPVVVAARQLRRGRDPLEGPRRLDHLRRGHDRARLPGRLLELRPRRRRRGARGRQRRRAAQRPPLRARRQGGAQRPAGRLQARPVRRLLDPARSQRAHRAEGDVDGGAPRHRRVALLLASKVLGEHPTTKQISQRLTETAHDLGTPGPDRYYAAGLVDATAALGARQRPQPRASSSG